MQGQIQEFLEGGVSTEAKFDYKGHSSANYRLYNVVNTVVTVLITQFVSTNLVLKKKHVALGSYDSKTLHLNPPLRQVSEIAPYTGANPGFFKGGGKSFFF